MKENRIIQRLLSLPQSKAKKVIRLAKIAIVALFIIVMASTAVVGWLLFTSPHKLISTLCLLILGFSSFYGGRLERYIHDAEQLITSKEGG